LKRKNFLTLVSGILLAAVLAAVPLMAACAPATPAELEEELDAERAKVAGLESEIAELKVPPKVYKWRFQNYMVPASVQSAISAKWFDVLREMSDGRLDIESYHPGTIVPASETFDAVSERVVEMGSIPDSYFESIIPIAGITDGASLLPEVEDSAQLSAYFWELGISDLVRDAYAEYNIFWLGHYTSYVPYGGISSTVPIRGVDDLKGLIIRSYGKAATILESFGATTTWCPGEEIYIGLATGVFDGATWASPVEHYDLSLHEVASYWTEPELYIGADSFLVNLDAWNELPDDLKDMLQMTQLAISSETLRAPALRILEVLAEWQDKWGITIHRWSDEDIERVAEVKADLWDELYATGDPSVSEALDIWMDFLRLRGQLD